MSVSWLRTLTPTKITEECYHDIRLAFHTHKIRTMHQVKMLNEHLLQRMGIVALGHTMVLLSAIDQYKMEEQHEAMTRADFLFDHSDSEDDDFFESGRTE